MKNRLSVFHKGMALFLCLVMFASLLPIGAAFADGEELDIAPAVEVAADAEAAPAAEESTEPAQEPAETEAPEETPAAEPEAVPAAEPAVEPEELPAAEPAVEPEEIPSAEPEAIPSEEPVVEPEDELIPIDPMEENASAEQGNLTITKPTMNNVVKSGNGLKVSWVAVTGADKYRVYRKGPSDTSWKMIKETTATSYVDTNVSNGTSYTYAVRSMKSGALNADGYNTKSATYWNYDTPKLSSVKVVDGGNQVSWASVGSVTYRVYRKHVGVDTNWVKIGETTGTSFTDKQVVSNDDYIYTVRVVSGSSFQSDFQRPGLTITFYGKTSITKLENVFVSIHSSGVKITWTKVTGVDNVRIERKLANESWGGASTKKIAVVPMTDEVYIDTDVSSDNNYTYRLIGVSATEKVMGTYDATGKNITFYESPYLDPNPVINANGVTINWDAVKGVTLYRVFRKIDAYGQSWQKLADVKTNSYTDKTAASGQNYVYTVRCLSADGKSFVSGYDPNGVKTGYSNTPVLVETVTTGAGINVTWKEVEGWTYYAIYRKSGTEDWKVLQKAWTGTPVDGKYTYSDADAASYSGTKFTYTVRCVDATGAHRSSYDPNGISGTYFPAPLNAKAKSVPGGIEVRWDSVPKAPKYLVYRRPDTTSPSAWEELTVVEGTVYTDGDSKLTSGYVYEYCVCVLDEDGNISSEKSVATKAKFYDAPKLESIEVVTDGITITWKPEADIVDYVVYRKTENSEWEELTTVPSSTTYTDKTVVSGTKYWYTVACYDSGSVVSKYDPAGMSATFFGEAGKFQILSCENKTEGILVTWNKVDHAVKYEVYRREENTTVEAYVKVGESTGLSFLDKQVKGNNRAKFHYSVKAVRADGTVSDYAKELPNAFQRWMTPTLVSVDARDGLPAGNLGEVILTWSIKDPAPAYNIYRKLGSGGWELIEKAWTGGETYTDPYTKLKSGKTYSYTVRCANTGGAAISDYDPNGLTITFLYAPDNIQLERNSKGVLVAWNAIEGATGYRIYRMLDGATSWELIKTVSGYSTLTWTDTSALTGSDYKYTVRAVKNSEHDWSGYMKDGATISFLAAPKITSLSSVPGGVKVMWGEVTNATGYEVRWKLDGKDWYAWKPASSPGFVAPCTASGAKIIFQVRAVKGSVRSAASPSVAILFYACPSSITATQTGLGNEYATVKITWAKVNNAPKYRVYRRVDGGSWAVLGETTGTSFVDKKAQVNTTYTYTVRVVDNSGNVLSGYDSNPPGAKLSIPYKLSAPALGTPTVAKGSITVKWTGNGAARYRVFRRTLDGSWVKVGDTTGTSFVDKTVTAGIYYIYTVRSLSSNGKFYVSSYDSTGTPAKLAQ